MGARLAGIDIIAPDACKPIGNHPVFVNEVNTTPDLLLNHFDVSGCGNAIASVSRLLTMVFAPDPMSSGDTTPDFHIAPTTH